uniref:Uncharacterized protein n=1 Tax=Manihot esculenta TaxID=3983 RepID=A0A2C9UYM9_MANES
MHFADHEQHFRTFTFTDSRRPIPIPRPLAYVLRPPPLLLNHSAASSPLSHCCSSIADASVFQSHDAEYECIFQVILVMSRAKPPLAKHTLCEHLRHPLVSFDGNHSLACLNGRVERISFLAV